MLKLILDALDRLAERLSENNESVPVDELRCVLEDCQQAIQELISLYNKYEQEAASDTQPGPSTKPLLAQWSLKSHGGDDWETECKDIDTFRILLQTRVKTLLFLSSKVSSRQPALPVILEGQGDSVEELGLKSPLATKKEKGSKAGRTSRQSSALIAKMIDSKAYHRLEKRLQIKKSPFDLPPSGSVTNISYVDSAPLSPLTAEFGSRPLHPVLTRECSDATQKQSSVEAEKDTLLSLCNRLAAAITQSSTNPRLSASTFAGPRSPDIVFGQPFSQPLARHQSPALLKGTEPTSSYQGSSYISHHQHELFEKKLLDNAAVLCEEKAIRVQYTEWNGKAHDWNVVQAASECRVLIIRRLKGRSQGTLQFATSIWVISSDRSVRLEQELDNGSDTIPYTGWGDIVKVSLRMNSRLKFHDISPDDESPECVQTSWTNYVFEQHAGSTNFQSALVDRTLSLSVRTVKTTRVHDGIAGMMKENEHLCGLENLRVWTDQGTGEVFAMIHFKPQFRIGYMIFQLNSAVHPLMLKEEGHRSVKITGLDMPAEGRRSSHPRISKKGSENEKSKVEKRTGSIRIEFATEDERDLFVQKYWSVGDVSVN